MLGKLFNSSFVSGILGSLVLLVVYRFFGEVFSRIEMFNRESGIARYLSSDSISWSIFLLLVSIFVQI